MSVWAIHDRIHRPHTATPWLCTPGPCWDPHFSVSYTNYFFLAVQVGATADADPLAVIWGKAVKGERKKEKWIKGKERAGKKWI